MATALKEGLGGMTAARQMEAELKQAEVVGNWYERLAEGKAQWDRLPAPIKALFGNKNPLED